MRQVRAGFPHALRSCVASSPAPDEAEAAPACGHVSPEPSSRWGQRRTDLPLHPDGFAENRAAGCSQGVTGEASPARSRSEEEMQQDVYEWQRAGWLPGNGVRRDPRALTGEPWARGSVSRFGGLPGHRGAPAGVSMLRWWGKSGKSIRSETTGAFVHRG